MMKKNTADNGIFSINIKTRILVFVILFELVAYSTIQLFNNYIYKNELLQLKNEEIQQTFAASTAKINNLSELMERNVVDIAIAGELLYELKRNNQLSISDLQIESERLLKANFSSFPEAIGGGIWYEPYVLDSSIKYFGPYAFKADDGVVFSWDLNTENYDYHNQDWYTIASQNGWGLEQKSYRPILWTKPYFDDAGTFSLMMTVDAVMLKNNHDVIGMATVDWSLTALTSFLESVRISDNSFPFFIHKYTGQFLSFPKDPLQVMKQAKQFSWAEPILKSEALDQLNKITNVDIDGMRYNIYFYTTNNGFIFGSLSPVSDMEKGINDITTVTLMAGAGIGACFILLMIVLMRVVFSPFDRVLGLIQNSITHKADDEKVVEVKLINYQEVNEFTPIIKALDEVYHQVMSYMSEIVKSNRKLLKTKAEVDALNRDLESKVQLRTEQLAAKTAEALNSLHQLQKTQYQLIEQEKHAALGRLVAGVAHEINTPLGIAVTAASTIEDRINYIYQTFNTGDLKKSDFLLNHQQLSDCSTILSTNLKRAADLVFNFKQVAVEQSSEQCSSFYLREQLASITDTLSLKISEFGHQVILDFDSSDFKITSFPDTIEQIINQIVENAVIHAFTGKKNGVVTIGAIKNNDQVMLSIADNGSGIEQTVLKYIFDPFFTTSRATGGSGLGLHLVYNLVTQQLNGSIECESQIGQGTVFTVSFPITQESAVEQAVS